MREIYTWVMALIQPFLRLKLLRRGRLEKGYLEGIPERWGDYRHLDDEERGVSHVWNESSLAYCPTLWVHAVSLGETRAAAVLLRQLRPALPGMRLLLTHGTATGRAEGQALLQAGDRQVWLPWDTPLAVGRFLKRFQPELGILIETEVWPNLVAGCKERRIPLLLVNARLSHASLTKALRLAWLARPAYRGLTAVYAQTHDDAARLSLIGAPVADVLGNVKFDATPPPHMRRLGQHWRAALGSKPVIVFASSREGEEALLLKRLAEMPPPERQAVQWLVVPRHPQRFDEVAALVQAAGLTLSRRSQWGDGEGDSPPCFTDADTHTDVWLGDSLGEMAAYYSLADLALLGGSFLPLGGQNLIEAAACGCPVIMGPHTFNFAEAAQNSAQAGAAFEVKDLPEGMEVALQMLQKPELLQQCRHATKSFVSQHRGATEKTVNAVLERAR